jgi:translocation and assembly module TamA
VQLHDAGVRALALGGAAQFHRAAEGVARIQAVVGVGLRWRSPVGPVRIDIAHGLDDPDSTFTLHLNIGADL